MKKTNNRKIPQSGRLGRLAQILLEQAGPEIAEQVFAGYEVHETGTRLRQKAAWIRQMVQKMEQKCSPRVCRSVMESCGQKCCGILTRKAAFSLWKQAASPEEFLLSLNQRKIGGGRLRLTNPNTITGGYDQCFCGQVKQTEEPFPGLAYCQCSAGWYKRLFESVLEKEVKVELLQSIISGSPTCEFLIHI